MGENINLFRSLSDLTRLRIVRLLLIHREKMSVGEIVEVLSAQQYNISKQLKILLKEEMLSSKKEGRCVFCFLNEDRWSNLKNLEAAILDLPDEGQIFAQDFQRWENQKESQPLHDKINDLSDDSHLPSNLL